MEVVENENSDHFSLAEERDSSIQSEGKWVGFMDHLFLKWKAQIDAAETNSTTEQEFLLPTSGVRSDHMKAESVSWLLHDCSLWWEGSSISKHCGNSQYLRIKGLEVSKEENTSSKMKALGNSCVSWECLC